MTENRHKDFRTARTGLTGPWVLRTPHPSGIPSDPGDA